MERAYVQRSNLYKVFFHRGFLPGKKSQESAQTKSYKKKECLEGWRFVLRKRYLTTIITVRVSQRTSCTYTESYKQNTINQREFIVEENQNEDTSAINIRKQD